MKLLLGQEEHIEDGGIVLDIAVVNTATQARMSDLSLDNTIEGRIKLVGYMLRNVITAVTVDGVNYVPIELATKADISDPATLRTFMKIGAMVIKVSFPSAAQVKK